jgi:hypothetical protein
MNSSVNASVEAAMIAAEWRTLIPAVTMLLPNARPTTPMGHAVQMWRKKNAIGGYVRPRGSGIRVYYKSVVSVLDADVASNGGGGLRGLYFRLLLRAAEKTFSHAVSSSKLRRCSWILSQLATNSRIGSGNVGFGGDISGS